MLTKVKNEYAALNSTPVSPYTVFDMPSTVHNMLDEVVKVLGA